MLVTLYLTSRLIKCIMYISMSAYLESKLSKIVTPSF